MREEVVCMNHRYTAYCENPFCLFVAEGIEVENPDDAETVALMLHGHNRRGSFELCREGEFPGPEITILHDLPCFTCVPEWSFDEEY